MSETATLDAARENADAVSRLIDQYLPPKGGGKNIQDVVTFARFLWHVVRDTWEQFQPRLDQGLEAGRACREAASAALACDSLLRVATQLDAALSRGAVGEVEGLSELLAAVPEATAIRKAARGLVDRLNGPQPAIDEARLAEGLAAIGRAEFEDTAAIVERLKAGGDL